MPTLRFTSETGDTARALAEMGIRHHLETTKEVNIGCIDITAQVVIVNISKKRSFDSQRAVILDKTPLYPPAQMGAMFHAW